MPWRESPAELERARAERPMTVSARCGTLFGIFTPPDPAAPPAGLCVVLLSRPRSHRNRMWIEGARRLASRGFAAFRFDYHGTGDSGGDSSRLDPNRAHREDIVSVLRHLHEHLGQRRFVIYGMCFDARTALSAFTEEAEAIAALVFVAAPCMELDDEVKIDADRKDWAHVWRALRNPENWRVLGDTERWRYMATVLRRIAKPRPGAGAAAPPLSASFVEHFRALEGSRARAFFLYGAGDSEYLSFREAERALWPGLSAEARARFEILVLPGVVHSGFHEMTRQREIYDRIIHWIEGLHPASRAAAANGRGTVEATWTSA